MITRDETLYLSEHEEIVKELTDEISQSNNSLTTLSTSPQTVKVVLTAVVDEEEITVEFDKVDAVTIGASSDVSEHPLVNGDTIADHMVRQPITLSLNGTFALSGHTPTTFKGTGGRLANIETLFEKIKNDGVFCTIVKLSTNDESEARFLVRDNMVLTSITWTENVNSLDFAFSFRQVITVDVDDPETFEDENLPNVYGLTNLSFTEEFVDLSDVAIVIVGILKENNLITSDFLEYYSNYVANLERSAGFDTWINKIVNNVTALNALMLTGKLVADIVTGVKDFIKSLCTWNWSNIWDTLATIIESVLNFITLGWWENHKQKKASKTYNTEIYDLKVTDNAYNDALCDSFTEYLAKVYTEVSQLDSYISVYGIEYDEDQSALLTVFDEYDVFTFTKNNTTQYYTLKVEDTMDNLRVEQATLTGLNSLSECTQTNALFKASNGGTVHIIKKDASSSVVKDLTNYMVLISSVNLEQFDELLEEVIENGMKA